MVVDRGDDALAQGEDDGAQDGPGVVLGEGDEAGGDVGVDVVLAHALEALGDVEVEVLPQVADLLLVGIGDVDPDGVGVGALEVIGVADDVAAMDGGDADHGEIRRRRRRPPPPRRGRCNG